MDEATIKISTCCKAEAIKDCDERDPESVFYICNNCSRKCFVTEVCSDCYDTKEIAVDVDDSEGHTMRGVGRAPCPRCVIKKRHANSYED